MLSVVRKWWRVGLAILFAFGAAWLRIAGYRAGARDQDTKHAADRAAEQDAAHDRLNNAPTHRDVPADDLPDRLRDAAATIRRDRG